MNKLWGASSWLLSLVFVGCKEPVSQPAATETAPAASAESVVPATGPSETVNKPAPADAKFPPGQLSLRVINGDCNVESVNGALYFDASPMDVDRSMPVTIAGWAVDKASNGLAADVSLVIEKVDLSKRWEVTGMPPIARQDVADYNKFPAEMVNSGFVAKLDLSDFDPGTYHLFLVRSLGQERIACDNSRQISLQ